MGRKGEVKGRNTGTRRSTEALVAGTSAVPSITPEERLRLAECCAFFEAEHYREAAPGRIRSTDVERARAQIDAVVENCGKAGCSGDT